jgi:SnoaL-like domain
MDAVSIENWELAARESVRDTIAAYTHYGDRFHLERFVDCFTVDGVLEVRDGHRLEGRQAILDFFSRRPIVQSEEPSPIRHNVANVHFTEVTPQLVKVSSYFTVFSRIGLDHYGRYRDELVPDGDRWRLRHRLASTDWMAGNSVVAAR